MAGGRLNELHDSGDVSDSLWRELRGHYDDAQLLELFLLCWWYHAISFVARAARVPLEDNAPTFASVR